MLNFENSKVKELNELEDVLLTEDLFTFSAVCLLWLIGEFFLLPLLLPPPGPRNMDDIAAVIEFLVARASWPESNKKLPIYKYIKNHYFYYNIYIILYYTYYIIAHKIILYTFEIVIATLIISYKKSSVQLLKNGVVLYKFSKMWIRGGKLVSKK